MIVVEYAEGYLAAVIVRVDGTERLGR